MKFINSVRMKTTELKSSTNQLPILPTFRSIVITSLEHNILYALEKSILLALERLQCPRLLDSTVLLLHKLIRNMVQTMYRHAFRQAIEHDLNISVAGKNSLLDELLKNELAAHGDRNIEALCKKNHYQITLIFPETQNTLIEISYPDCCSSTVHLDEKLAEALGFVLIKPNSNKKTPGYQTASIIRDTTGYLVNSTLPKVLPLLDRASEADRVQSIFFKLNYSIVVFSGAGDILAISPAIRDTLKLEISHSPAQNLAGIIPAHFYNDVIWGAALQSPDGTFENYRVRIRTSDESGLSVLFNVSGYRHYDMTIHSLWQIVSLEHQTADALTEGSLLNEVKVHNITRHYVPELVEQKARETVRLGGHALPNEECYLAILFCDVAEFTRYVEQNEQEESIIHTLNLILGRIAKVVRRYGGMIDKFMGDCVMALFREPHNAVLASLEIQKHSRDFNGLRLRAGKDQLPLRIGIHWGKVTIGNVGFSGRLDWTTIGDIVNTASRLEKNCRPGAVLISEILYETIVHIRHTDVSYGQPFSLELRGKRDQLTVRYVETCKKIE